tara:strand:- start:718 stop:1020 length:303 start_codon:yes stop_codon:yes gene_type:complete
MILLKNTTSATTTLIAKRSKADGYIGNIAITNVSTNDADAAIIDVYIEDASANKFYLVKNISVPHGVCLYLDKNVKFDASVYSLKVQNDGSNRSLTIMIK